MINGEGKSSGTFLILDPRELSREELLVLFDVLNYQLSQQIASEEMEEIEF